MNEWIQFSPTAADGDHSYFPKSQPMSDPVQELLAPLQSLDLEVQQVVEGEGKRMPCWTSGMPIPAGGGFCVPWGRIWGDSVCVGGGRVGAEGRMCSDPACGCRGCRTVGTSCVASAWTRCGTSQRPSGFLASCPTAATPTAWTACVPGGRAEGTSRWVSSSQCHGGASREGGKGPTEG